MQRVTLVLLMALPVLTAAALPRSGPVPAPKPAVEEDEAQPVAKPAPKPAETPDETPDETSEDTPPGETSPPVPTPEPRPEDGPRPSTGADDPAASEAGQEATPGKAEPPKPEGENKPGQGPAENKPGEGHGESEEGQGPAGNRSGQGPGESEEGQGPTGNRSGQGPGEDRAGQSPAESDEEKQPATPPPPPAPPVASEDAEALKTCLADLAALGTKFKAAARIDEGQGCGIDRPLEVAEVLPGVDAGGAQMRCETARSLARWLKDTVAPALRIAMPGRSIAGLSTGSTYACRLRNGASEGKISEHARGNAIDIAAFRLDDGSEITMKPRAEDGTLEGAFQRTATAGACLHFTTVLSPGSDAAHQDHLHLDVLERDSGYRYCR